MEISTVPRRAPTLPGRWRVFAALVVLLPVTAFAVVPLVLGLDRYVIAGTSMEGSIDRGSVVLERPTPVGDLRAGDVITFEPPAGSADRALVTHRIVSVDTRGITTKGDANPSADPWTLEAGPQSKVVLAVPYVGYPFTASLDRGVWVLVVLAALCLVLAVGRPGDAPSTRRHQRRHQRSLAGVSRGVPR